MIQCPDCRSMIPDESAFCDQCGKELMWCPECKRPKRGTECPVCGSDLVPGRRYLAGGIHGASATGEGAASDPVRGSAAHPSQPSGWAPPSNGAEGGTPPGGSASPAMADASASLRPNPAPQATSVQPAAGPARLVGSGFSLQLVPGIFGRTGGIWPELSSCKYVSGRHGQISGGGTDWSVTDLGSTNGTFVDGQRLQPNVAVPLKKGSRVKIATLEFTVE